MPVHDWSRVGPGIFHDFHQSWIVAIRDVLNAGLLPADHYALAEQDAAGPIPDVLTLEQTRPADDETWSGGAETSGGLAVADNPPQVRFKLEAPEDVYAKKASRIAVYHSSGDRIVGYIEIISNGNKRSDRAMQALLEKVREAMDRGLHLLLVDLQPPTPRDPRGLHERIWRDWYGESAQEIPGATAERPFTLVAYRADLVPTAYYEPVGLCQTLPDMPIFLTPDRYINVPLESTYLAAWKGVPRRWKEVITAAS